MSAPGQVQLQRRDKQTPVSETALRQLLGSMDYHCNRYDYPPGTVSNEHSHADDKIDAVLSGCLRITVGDQQYDLQPGDYIYIPRDVMHSAEVIGNETVVSLDGVKLEM